MSLRGIDPQRVKTVRVHVQGEAMVRELQDVEDAVDEQLDAAAVQLFTGGKAINDAGDASDSDGAVDSAAGTDDEADGSEHSDDASDWSSEGEEEAGAPKNDPRNRRRADFTGGPGEIGDREAHEGATGGDSSSAEEEADEDDGNTAHWRSNMLVKQSKLFSVRAGDIKRVIYGEKAVYSADALSTASVKELSAVRDITNAVDHADESDDEELFQLKRPGGGDAADGAADGTPVGGAGDIDGVDSVYAWLGAPADALSRWIDAEEMLDSLRRRIVTGGEEAFDDARKRSAAEGQGEYADSDDGSDGVYGDFEDVETGQLFSGVYSYCCCCLCCR